MLICPSDISSGTNVVFRSSRPEVFCKKGVLRNFTKFTGKHLCQSFFFNRPATLLKKKLWHRCFPVNFVKFLRTPFLQNTSGGCFCYVVRTSFYFETLFSTQPINLVLEEISRNKSVVQTSITCSTNQIEKNVSIRHSSVLTLMKSEAPFFRIDIMYMIYLDAKYFSVVSLSI